MTEEYEMRCSWTKLAGLGFIVAAVIACGSSVLGAEEPEAAGKSKSEPLPPPEVKTDLRAEKAAVEFVDGPRFDCEILFQVGDRVVMRSLKRATVQTFGAKEIHAVIVDGKRTELNPKRALTRDEKESRGEVLWADDPMVDDPKRTPDYAKQAWPEARLVVWAYPGRTGKWDDLNNWLEEDGTRAAKPLTPDCDVLIPAAAEKYSVLGDYGDRGVAFHHRHLTVERNAQYTQTFVAHGNFWVKKAAAGLMGYHRGTFHALGRHAFARFEGGTTEWHRKEKPHESFATRIICHYLALGSGPAGSLEYIGAAGPKDMTNTFGNVVVAEDSWLNADARRPIVVHEGATLSLMSGARVHRRLTTANGNDVRIHGLLRAGTPERPITRDVHVRLSGTAADYYGLWLAPNGRIEVHSADATKARLVFKYNHNARVKHTRHTRGLEPTRAIRVLLQGRADFNGVMFDDVQEGGIVLADLSARDKWKNVLFGDNNAASGKKLFSLQEPGEKMKGKSNKFGVKEGWEREKRGR
jgi:hypothetical protein